MKRVKFGVYRHFGRALWIFLIMVTLWLKLVIHVFGVSGHYLENVGGLMSRGGRRHISDALRRVLSSYVIICDVLSISYVKMNLSQIFRNDRHFGVRVRF